MALLVDKNVNYGPPLVSQKYRPLEKINFASEKHEFFGRLMSNRLKLLKDLNLLPATLQLYVRNWDEIVRAEAGRHPPLVVVSSSRSQWMTAAIQSSQTRLTSLGEQNFENVSDLRALAMAPPSMSPPIYSPLRIGDAGPRNVYVVVHQTEYMSYQSLSSLGITVVGWAFRPPDRANAEWLVGFGASRFACIEFCKALRKAATPARGTAPWNYAWLIDDNVVALSGFPGYLSVERAMTLEHVCAGFRGGTQPEPFSSNQDWASKAIAAGRGRQRDGLPTAEKIGLIQQMALWNIDYLTKNNLNFGPTFLESAEDLSLVYYFDVKKIPYLYYGGIGILKEIVSSHDEFPLTRELKAQRRRLVGRFNTMESDARKAEGPAPPPIRVKPINEDDTKPLKPAGTEGLKPEDLKPQTEQILADFVVNRVLPAAIAVKASDANVQDIAKCHAVEQIISLGIEAKFVAAKTAFETFEITKNQEVEIINA